MNALPPSAVGVPEITPVLASRFKPSGREPPVTLHVIGAVPSAKRVVLYAASAVPFDRLAVVIVGVYFTLSPRLFFIPSSSVPPSTITLWPLAFRFAPLSSIRLSPSPMIKSFCKLALPYTVPVLPLKTMPLFP